MRKNHDIYKIIKNDDVDNLIKYCLDRNEKEFKIDLREIDECDDILKHNLYLLHLACFYSSLECLKFIIKFWNNFELTDETDFSMNIRNNNDETVLHFASMSDNFECIDFLFDFFNFSDEMLARNNISPLYYAVKNRNKNTIMKLAKKCDINYTDENGDSYLHLTIKNRDEEISELLINMGININIENKKKETPLITSILYDLSRISILLLRKNCHINQNFQPHILELALSHKRLSVAEELLKRKDIDFKSCALYAASVSQSEILRILFESFDNPIFMYKNTTPLHCAVLSGDINSVFVLLNIGYSVNSVDGWKRTPLHIAASSGYDNIVQILIGERAKINQGDNLNLTPLHHSCMSGQKTTCEVLLSLGANINSQDIFRRTPLYYAKNGNFEDICDILIRKGASQEFADLLQ